MILQTNLAIGSTNFNGIMYQVHYIDNQFSLKPFSLHVVKSFMIWYPYSQFHNTNFTKYVIYFTKNIVSIIEFS
jgi:hypothetical protein